jgi:integrase
VDDPLYEKALRLRVIPELGDRRLSDLRRIDVQDLADQLLGGGHSPATIQLTVASLRAVCRRAVKRGELVLNPCDGVELPAVRNGRDRIASPAEAAKLLAALPEADRPLWATALYAGLRRGELQALRWSDVDLKTNVVRVERSWDNVEGPIAPKTAKGKRTVPIADVLREHLIAHRLRTGGRGLVFGNGDRPPRLDAAQVRADEAWTTAGLSRVTPHDCRHTFASLMIAAGCNAKALSTYMGHASIAITYDRYGHLMPGNEAEAATLLDAYLKRATGT